MLLHAPKADQNLGTFVKILDSDEAVAKDQQVFSSVSGSSKPCGVVSAILHPSGRSKRSGAIGF